MKIIVVGGGWAGCAAALQAGKMGAETILIERTDMLLGTGLVGGIMRNNGRYTAAEELIAMGGGDVFKAIDGNYLHENIEFPGHEHASLYNVATMEPIIRNLLETCGVKILFETRVTDAETDDDKIKAIIARVKSEKSDFRQEGDAFIDTTGTAGPPANCNKYGNGCAMCILRCHSYGGRVSLAAKAGVKEMIGRKGEQVGAMSGACKIHKESLEASLREELNKKGVAVVPIPPDRAVTGKLSIKACQQYALPEFEQNIILLDTGHAKLMSPYFPLEALRRIPGFENARYEDPYAGGLGNSIRYIGMSPRNDALLVEGVQNLFCAGEKAGLLVGHTEAICTGTLAGYNAVQSASVGEQLTLPADTAIGDAVGFVREMMGTEAGLSQKFTFSGSVYFDRMKNNGLYSMDISEIEQRVEKAGLRGVFHLRH